MRQSKCAKCGIAFKKGTVREIRVVPIGVVDQAIYLCDGCEAAWWALRDKVVKEAFYKYANLAGKP